MSRGRRLERLERLERLGGLVRGGQQLPPQLLLVLLPLSLPVRWVNKPCDV